MMARRVSYKDVASNFVPDEIVDSCTKVTEVRVSRLQDALERPMHTEVRVSRLQDDSRDAYTEVGGTTPGMGKVELSLERKSRATHDYMDVEGRIASGTAIEDAKAEGGGTPPWMEKVRLHGSNR